MDFVFLENFFAGFTVPTVIIAIISGTVNVLFDKFLADKVNATLRNYAVFMLAVILYVAFDALFVLKAFEIRTQTLYSGILSGSLSMILSSAFKRISEGKSIGGSATRLLIESLIEEYVSANSITATAIAIEKLFNDSSICENKIEKIKDVIAANANCVIDQDELLSVAKLIIQSINALNNE